MELTNNAAHAHAHLPLFIVENIHFWRELHPGIAALILTTLLSLSLSSTSLGTNSKLQLVYLPTLVDLTLFCSLKVFKSHIITINRIEKLPVRYAALMMHTMAYFTQKKIERV